MLRRCIADTLRKPTTPAYTGAGCAGKVIRRPGAHHAGKRIINKIYTLPIITACKTVITNGKVSHVRK
jgi:hypothetical protein